MNCVRCTHPFNLSDRYPLELPCCNYNICKKCKEELTEVPQQETFLCPMTSCGERNSCQANFKINRAVEQFLRESLSIFCDEHPNNLSEFYCKDHDLLVCMGCFVGKHNTHQYQNINKQMLSEYHTIILEKLEAEYKRIGRLMTAFEAYQKNQISFTATKYLSKVKKALEILSPRMKTQEERDMIKLLNHQPQLQNQMQQNPQQVQPLIQNIDSLIIEAGHHAFIKECFGQANIQIELLYRGTRDTFAYQVFHSKCDNQGPTLTVIKSEHNRIFGGYASISWNNNNQWKADDKAFIISITNNTKHTQYQNQQYAVYHCSSYGPRFGSDIIIYDNCNNNNNSNSNLGYTYSLPNGMQYNTDQSQSYLAGSYNYKVTEIEVFKVINY